MKIFKVIIIGALMISLSLAATTPLYAQGTETPRVISAPSTPTDTTTSPSDPTVISAPDLTASKYVTVETKVGTQSVMNGEIPIFIYITPKIDSNRTQIVVDAPRGLKAKSSTNTWISMKKDEGQSFTLKVKPESSGHYRVSIQVIIWQYDTNYIESSSVSFDIDNSLRVSPASSDYTKNLIILRIVEVAGIALGIGIIMMLVKIYLFRIKKWIKEQNQKEWGLKSLKTLFPPKSQDED